jgi:hypothetical protein
MSGFTEVRHYRNTVDEVPAEYTNVTAAVLNSSTKNHATGVKRYLDGVTTVSGLGGGTHYFWVELIDARGDTGGAQPVGHVHIRHDLDMKLVDHGNNIVAEADLVLFNGSNSYARFADIGEAGVDYCEFVRSGTWSMTFWIKPLVDPSEEIRFLVMRELDVGLVILSNKQLVSFAFDDIGFNLTKDAWYFFALSVDDYRWTIVVKYPWWARQWTHPYVVLRGSLGPTTSPIVDVLREPVARAVRGYIYETYPQWVPTFRRGGTWLRRSTPDTEVPGSIPGDGISV